MVSEPARDIGVSQSCCHRIRYRKKRTVEHSSRESGMEWRHKALAPKYAKCPDRGHFCPGDFNYALSYWESINTIFWRDKGLTQLPGCCFTHRGVEPKHRIEWQERYCSRQRMQVQIEQLLDVSGSNFYRLCGTTNSQDCGSYSTSVPVHEITTDFRSQCKSWHTASSTDDIRLCTRNTSVYTLVSFLDGRHFIPTIPF